MIPSMCLHLKIVLNAAVAVFINFFIYFFKSIFCLGSHCHQQQQQHKHPQYQFYLQTALALSVIFLSQQLLFYWIRLLFFSFHVNTKYLKACKLDCEFGCMCGLDWGLWIIDTVVGMFSGLSQVFQVFYKCRFSILWVKCAFLLNQSNSEFFWRSVKFIFMAGLHGQWSGFLNAISNKYFKM